MWDLPGPGLEPVSPALAGGFLTTAPPGKPLKLNFLKMYYEKNLHINESSEEGIINLHVPIPSPSFNNYQLLA